MPDKISPSLDRDKYRPAATSAAIAGAEAALGTTLPAGYVAFLKTTNGYEGFAGQGEYAMLWGVEELAPMNNGYRAGEYAPGLLLFGSNGGGEAFSFDTRQPEWPIVMVPFIPLEWSLALLLGETFPAFLQHLHKGGAYGQAA